MNKHFFLLFFFAFSSLSAEIFVGVATEDITPPIGTPSAGYEKRKGAPMQGVQDPLLASAMVVDNGEKKIVFASVDHLGLPHTLIEKIKAKLPDLADASFYIGCSHTHSGGGAFLDMPVIGELLAGPYDAKIAQTYVDGVADAIVKAAGRMQPAKIGIGYSKVEGITQYRSKWPERFDLENDLAVIKVTTLADQPVAILFNFALHPTVLGPENMHFSSDFVGHARNELKKQLGGNITCLYFNGAQAEIIPLTCATCSCTGSRLGAAAATLWQTIKASDTLSVKTRTRKYSFTPETTPFGLKVPLEQYQSELSVLILNDSHAFAAIPGELSALYAAQLRSETNLHLSILGLVNDAHGYIITPEAYHAKTMESGLSFGGEQYGTQVHDLVLELLQN